MAVDKGGMEHVGLLELKVQEALRRGGQALMMGFARRERGKSSHGICSCLQVFHVYTYSRPAGPVRRM